MNGLVWNLGGEGRKSVWALTEEWSEFYPYNFKILVESIAHQLKDGSLILLQGKPLNVSATSVRNFDPCVHRIAGPSLRTPSGPVSSFRKRLEQILNPCS